MPEGAEWFEGLMGFNEAAYEETRAKLAINGDRLQSLVNLKTYQIGSLELSSLKTLRARTSLPMDGPRKIRSTIVRGDVRALHADAANSGALFQVASQFNLLEMVSPEVSPRAGVACYANDLTQGPACAIAAGAATIYRNYFAQTPEQQIDGLEDIGAALSEALETPLKSLWTMRNGYALPTYKGLADIAAYLAGADEATRDALRAKLKIGVHWDVEVTDATAPEAQIVSQAFCSAMPVSYTYLDEEIWEAFATLTLEAAYEGTLRAAILNAERGRSNVVYLTMLGGGAFGNRPVWILNAMARALNLARGADLDVRLVSYHTPWRRMVELFDQN
ncbi:MAG: hypothetical protein ABL889_10300 [Terricaulis sp.]